MLRRCLVVVAFLLALISTVGAQTEPAPASATEKKAAASPAEPRTTFNSVFVEGPFIAITFDDGPDQKLTPKLLDLLARLQIKATFFVIGQNASEFPEIVRRAAREGHEIANHSWSHPNLGKMSDESVRRELRKTDDAIMRATGVRPTLMRPPYGSITAHQKRWIPQELGLRIILWDVDPLDWKRPGPSIVCNRIVANTRAGSIILAHDIHAPTIEAMPATLEQLAAKGFKFVTVSELLAMARPEPVKVKATPSESEPTAAASREARPKATSPVPTPAER